MKNLLKWQMISFISRAVAMMVGIIQSAVIVRILTVSEYGVVTLAASVGAAFGVYQHLGLASGSTREIASADNDTEVFKIFITSAVIRYVISIPLATVLFFLSEYIALTQYQNAALVMPLKIFSVILLIQGVQSILNSVISGKQHFKQLFIYQVVIALVGLLIYIPLVYFYKVNGYFYALAAFNLVGSISLGFLALKPLKTKFVLPDIDDFKRLLKDILSISLAIYAVKIIYTYWQRSGPILLGLSLSAEEIGLFGLALLYGTKLMTVSDSVTDVNLPVLSKKFKDSMDDFKELFSNNFDKIFAFIVFAAVSAIFWVKEIVFIFVGSGKYDGSFPYIFPLVIAFVFYSVINIVKSSILVPAKMIWEMIAGYLLMLLGTLGFYYLLTPALGNLMAMSLGMVFGAIVGVFVLAIAAWLKIKYFFLKIEHLALLVIGLLLPLIKLDNWSVEKFGAYFLFAFGFLILTMLFKIITVENILFLKKKVFKA